MQGTVVAVTGASSPTGRAIARAVAAAGADVALLAPSVDETEPLAAELVTAGRRVATFAIGLRGEATATGTVREVARQLAVPDVWVANVGATAVAELAVAPPHTHRRVVGLHMRARVREAYAVLRLLGLRGRGLLIHNALVAGELLPAWQGGHAAAVQLVRSLDGYLQRALPPDGVRAEAILPRSPGPCSGPDIARAVLRCVAGGERPLRPAAPGEVAALRGGVGQVAADVADVDAAGHVGVPVGDV